MLLLIDNYDSFTWNLVHLIGTAARRARPGLEMQVRRNDEIDPEQALSLRPDYLVISPGPCSPCEAGASGEILRHLAAAGTPTLGVCLGHQCLASTFGATIVRAKRPVHGKTDQIHHDGRGIFTGLPTPFTAARYHSLIVDRTTVAARCLKVSAWTAGGEVMALRHRHLPLEGVQFHPESFLTEHGEALLANFLQGRRCR